MLKVSKKESKWFITPKSLETESGYRQNQGALRSGRCGVAEIDWK